MGVTCFPNVSCFLLKSNIDDTIYFILLFSCLFLLVPSYGLKSHIQYEDREGQEQNHDVSGSNILELIKSKNFEVIH